jgi:hypothetical protein
MRRQYTVEEKNRLTKEAKEQPRHPRKNSQQSTMYPFFILVNLIDMEMDARSPILYYLMYSVSRNPIQ